ncbi:hypothetical protein ILUMI_05361 [Ignelater luminosus]|uniref:Protein takeout n=1 Tax=Ignelater luminosus TaxID=2038154 RepID=A0A8K0GGF7_IGNLU|nr:hypothetical protein ILUMI_05361 [Ignelater luminosus]
MIAIVVDRMNRGIITLFLVVAFSYAAKLPSGYQTCKHDDPNFSECLKTAVQDAFSRLNNGISTFKVPPLEPVNIPSITIGEGKGAVNVVQNYKSFDLYGVGTSQIGKFEAKLTDNEFTVEAEADTPEVRFEADYSFNGRVLLLPIVGDGKCVVKLQNLKTKFTLRAESFEKGGKKYLKVKDMTIKLTPGKVIYNFEHLFNGDQRLGEEMNKVLNDNWKEVYNDIGDQYETVLQEVFIDYANKIFGHVPYDDLF